MKEQPWRDIQAQLSTQIYQNFYDKPSWRKLDQQLNERLNRFDGDLMDKLYRLLWEARRAAIGGTK